MSKFEMVLIGATVLTSGAAIVLVKMVLKLAGTIAKMTKTTADDEIVATLKQGYDELIGEVETLKVKHEENKARIAQANGQPVLYR